MINNIITILQLSKYFHVQYLMWSLQQTTKTGRTEIPDMQLMMKLRLQKVGFFQGHVPYLLVEYSLQQNIWKILKYQGLNIRLVIYTGLSLHLSAFHSLS